MNDEITSRTNPLYKELKQIADKKKNGFVFIEGRKLFEEAINSSIKIKNVFVDKNNKELITRFKNKKLNPEIIYMKNELISSLFTTDNFPLPHDLIVATAERPGWNTADLFKLKKHLICLVQVQDPGNVGAIFRSALAFNAGGILLLDNCADPFNTKVVRTSAGAVFKLPFVKVTDLKELKNVTEKNGYILITTSGSAKKGIRALKLNSPGIFVFGNEGRGLPEDLFAISDEVVKLPHSSSIESLNVSVAVSILMWEMYNNS